MPDLLALPTIPAVVGMAQAEADAVNALATFMTTEEGQRASDDDLRLWLIDRGWPPSKLRSWTERISAYLALACPDAGDPRVLTSRFSVRLERLAHRAEEMNDMKHAIEATKVQATLHKIGGYAPSNSQTNVQVNITNGNAHLVSDEDLLRVANAQVVPDADPLLA